MIKRSILILLTGSLAGCTFGNVKLPFENLTYSEVCPGFDKVRCHPDDDPRSLRFNLVPPIVANRDGEIAYEDFLGRAFRQKYRRGDIGRPCSVNSIDSPFSSEDFDISIAGGNFTYTYTLNSVIDVDFAANISSKAEMVGLSSTDAERVKDLISIEFDRVKNDEVFFIGRMEVHRLTTRALDEVRFGSDPTFEPCRQFLDQNSKYAIVKAATVFRLTDATASSVISNDLKVGVNAALNSSTIPVTPEIVASIDREIDETIESALDDRTQLWAVSWLKRGDS